MDNRTNKPANVIEPILNKDLKILIVDDDPDVLFGTTKIMKDGGYQTFTAANGKEAMEAVYNLKPDLILLDVILPDTKGTDLCRQIKSDPNLKGIYVILTSGVMIESNKQADGLDAGADGYITRPLSNREMLSRVNSMMRILKAERERDQLILDLQKANSEIKQLRGIIPICMHCKEIRDDKGFWNNLEIFISKNSEAKFSHGICPECVEKHYPQLNKSHKVSPSSTT